MKRILTAVMALALMGCKALDGITSALQPAPYREVPGTLVYNNTTGHSTEVWVYGHKLGFTVPPHQPMEIQYTVRVPTPPATYSPEDENNWNAYNQIVSVPLVVLDLVTGANTSTTNCQGGAKVVTQLEYDSNQGNPPYAQCR